MDPHHDDVKGSLSRLKCLEALWGEISLESFDLKMISAEIGAFCFHDLRHTFASKLAMKDTSLNTIHELMGHSEISTTLRYAHLAPKYLDDAVEGI